MSIPNFLNTEIVRWEVPKFPSFREDDTLEFKAECVSCTNLYDNPNYELKMQYATKSKCIFFYFRSPSDVHLESIKWIQPGPRAFSFLEIINECTMYAYQWTFLCSVHSDLFNDSVNIELQFSIINNSVPFYPYFERESQLVGDFGDLLIGGMFSDVVFRSVDGVECKAHKAILSSRSYVFKDLFENHINVNTFDTLLDTIVLEELLFFIYTDYVPKSFHMPEQLLQAAYDYKLDRLIGMLEEDFYEKLSVENAIKTLELAERFKCENLKTLVVQFIRDNAHLVTRTQDYIGLESPELIKLLFENVLK